MPQIGDETEFESAGTRLPRYNHYVPKFILKNFTQNGKLCIFDKHTSREFKLRPRRAMGENDFTNVKIGDAILSFENKFAHLENRAAPIIKMIVENKSLASLNPMEAATLHTFVILQHLRSKRRKLDQDFITEEIKKRWPNARINPCPEHISDEELTKLSALEFAFSKLEELTKYLVAKHSYLIVKNCGDEVYISDNPLVMHNQKQFGPYGNIGVAVPHIEIYYPLSPDVILAYACPLTIKEIEETQQKSDKVLSSFFGQRFLSPAGLSATDMADLAKAKAEIQRAKNYYTMIKYERVVPADSQNILYLNSLQVSSSYRYIAAKRSNFQFARTALAERPHWKEGRQLQIS